jgi:cytochrome c biogenesis protein CcdA
MAKKDQRWAIWKIVLLVVGFGLGAIAIPSLVYGVGFAHLGSQLRDKLDHWRPHIARLGALLLIVVGGRNLIA